MISKPPSLTVKRVLACIEPDLCPEVIITHAHGLVRALHARLTVLHVVDHRYRGPAYHIFRQAGELALAQAQYLLRGEDEVDVRLEEGNPLRVILREVEAVDLVLIASRAKVGWQPCWQGSLVGALLRHSHTAVHVIPCPDAPTEEGFRGRGRRHA